MNVATSIPLPAGERPAPPEVEVIIEIPKGSFIKRGSTGQVDFVSPLPCPFNYGSVPTTSDSRAICSMRWYWGRACKRGHGCTSRPGGPSR